MSLSELTIAQAHEKLKTQEITCRELVQACIDAIEAQNDELNAVVHKEYEYALAAADVVDAKGEFPNLLTGIPYLTKDNFCEKNRLSTAASNMLRKKDYKPPFDSTSNKRLNALGAISLGKVNTDEFTMGASTETSCFGVTRNPHDKECVAGGSSGGSAAAVAANMCLFALGTDTGGSIRLPASFCGVVGMRTTYGRTSRYGVMSMASSLDTIGPICKNIEDTAIVLEALSGQDPFDGTTADVPVPTYFKNLKQDVSGLTIGVPTEYFTEGIQPEVEQAVRDAIEKLKAAGATIKEISLPHTKYAIQTYYIISPCEVSSNMARYDGIRFGHHPEQPAEKLLDHYKESRSEGFGEEVQRRIMIGTYALSAGYYDAYYRQALKVRAILKQEFDEVFKDVDVIMSPVSPTTSFKVGAHAGDPVAMYLEDVFLTPQPMAGIPCLSVPCGKDVDGLPIGLQIAGPQWGEQVVLDVARAWEDLNT
jgi:aspartyl-tRNA(Asn)/glutamyl-tRNA(Gln) amidotransferase subunit A